MAERILDSVGLKPDEKTLIRSAFAKSQVDPESLDQLRSNISASVKLTVDEFALISDWEHFAILSLVRTEDFVGDPEWIAQRLRLPQEKIRKAVERLTRLEVLKITPSGQWRRAQPSYTSTDGEPNESVRRAHGQALQLVQRSLSEDAIEIRDFSQITLSLDPAQLPTLRARIRAFQDEIAELCDRSSQKEVYKLAVQLFPVSTPTQNLLSTKEKNL